MTEQANDTSEARSVMDRALCLVIEFGGFGLKRSASKDRVKANADDKMWGVSKKLLDSPEHAAIVARRLTLKKWLKSVSLPSPLKAGSHLIPFGLVEQVEQALQIARNEDRDLVEAFLAVYSDQARTVQNELRDLYDPRDYPSCDALRERYRIEWQYTSYGTPGQLKAISAKLFEVEREKQARNLTEAATEINQALRASFADLVSKMAESLGPAEDGKRRVLRQATIDNLAQFMQIFEMRNIANDTELAALVVKARELMAGKDREILKSDKDLRQTVAESFATMADTLGTMVIDRGTRQISLDDDEAVA